MSGKFDPAAYASENEEPSAKGGGFDPAAYAKDAGGMVRDGVEIPEPTDAERPAFEKWLKANRVNEPFHPDQHYDYVGAFRAGVGRAKGKEGHFTDQFKLPGHETFSDESQYAKGEHAARAGSWDGDTFIPPKAVESKLDPLTSEAINGALKWARANPNDERSKRLLPKLEAMEASAKGRMGDRIMEGAKLTGADAATLGWGDEMATALGHPEKGQHLRETVQQFRKENPKLAMMSSVAGGAPMLLAPNSLPVALAAGAVSGLGGSDKSSVGDAALDTAIGAGVGGLGYGLGKGLVAGGQWLGGKAIEKLGQGAQLPQKAYEKLAEWIGQGSDSAAAASAKPSSRSTLQQGLKGVIDDAQVATMGPEAGGAVRAAEQKLAQSPLAKTAQDMLEQPLSSLNSAQRGALMEAVATGMQRRGLKVDAAAVHGVFDDLVRAAGKEPNEITAREAIRLVNQRDPAFAQQLAVNASKKWAPIRKGMDVDPREAQAVELGQGMLDDVAAGAQNRFNVRGESGGVAQLLKDTPVPQLDPQVQAEALARARARDAAAAQARAAANPDNVLTNPNGLARGGVPMNEPTDTAQLDGAARLAMKEARLASQRSPAGQQRAQQIMAEVNDQVAARGVDPRTAGATPSPDEVGILKAGKVPEEATSRTTEPWNDFDGDAAKRLTGTADPNFAGPAAKDRIRAINAGKERIGRYETVGNVVGAGIPSMAKMAASDVVAGTGREMERIGASMASPDKLAKSWVNDPSILRPLAQRPDKIGAGARFVLEGLNESGMEGLKARTFLLSMQPWFRAEIAQSQSQEQ